MGQKSRYPLPLVVDPDETVCFLIRVPKERFHVAAFMGAMYNLSKPYAWENDAAHTALAVGRVWRRIYDALKPDPLCGKSPATAGVEIEDVSRFRIDPVDCTIIQIECQPDEWEQFYPPKGCANAGPAQPPPAGGGPGAGETKSQCFALPANGQALLPFPVAGGYVLFITSMSGGWNDGSNNWFCPNGQQYTLGFCTGVGGYTGGDPLPTALHMSLIVKINGVYYPTDGPINVPAGTPSSDVFFLANDASPSDNNGTIQFCVDVKNAAEPGFDHTFNFATTNGGWVAAPRSEGPGCSAAGANYVSGTGWTEFSCPSINAIYINAEQSISPRTLTQIKLSFSGTDFAANPADAEIYITQGGVETLVQNDTGITSSPHDIIASGNFPAVEKIRFRIAALNSSAHMTLFAAEVQGAGSDPF